MTETIYRGRWWLPGAPDQVEFGSLRVEDNGNVFLELVEGFPVHERVELGQENNVVTSTVRDVGDRPLILGSTGRTWFTLLNCTLRSASDTMLSAKPRDEVLQVGRVFEGVHLDAADEPFFYGVQLEIDYSLLWMGRTTLHFGPFDHKPGSPEALAAAVERPRESRAVRFDIDDLVAEYQGVSLTISVGGTSFYDGWDDANTHVLRSRESAYLTIAGTEAHPASYWDSFTARMQNLITLSMNYPCAVRSRTFGVRAEGTDNINWNVPCYGKQVYVPDSRPFKDIRTQVFCTLHDFEFSSLVPAWLELCEKVNLPIAMLAGLHYLDDGYTSTKLMTVLSLAESLHRELYDHDAMPPDRFDVLLAQALNGVEAEEDRTWLEHRLKNQLSYTRRMAELAKVPDRAAVKALVGAPKKWANIATQTRNGLAHVSSEEGDHELRLRLMLVTRTLMTLVLFARLGLSAEAQLRIVRSSSGVWFNSGEFKKLIGTEPKSDG